MTDTDKIRKYLFEWSEHYFKSRDSFNKKIVSISHDANLLIIEYKDRKEKIKVSTSLAEIGAGEGDNCIVVLNNRSNVEELYLNWSKYSRIHELKIYFINPLSTTERKWIINPSVHAKICDESSLKTGLMSMFETVDPITVEMLEKKL